MYTKLSPAVRLTLACAALAIGAIAPTSGAAQSTAPGSIEGRVIDSVHSTPPDGTPVQAVRLSPEPRIFASVLADAQGRFRLDSLSPGRYWLTFTSPFLDSLGIATPDREVIVEGGKRTRADLAIPSGATIRAAVCRGLGLTSGRGGVTGTVVTATTELPLANATVVVGWNEWKLDSATVRVASTPRVGTVVTDSLGRYRLCGVPTDVPLQIQVQHGGAASAVVQATMQDAVGMLRQDLSFSVILVADARSDTGTSRAERLPPATGTASVAGVVLSALRRPLADVAIRITGAAGLARSDSLGRFSLSGLPAGTQMLEARRIGYSMHRMQVELRSGRVVTQDVVLGRIVSLDSIRIVAQRTLYADFEQHKVQGSGFGRFMDASQIERLNPFETSDLMRMQSGFTMQDDVLISARGSTFDGAQCAVNVVIDGNQHMKLTDVHPSDIAGMELYRSGVGALTQYDSFCGQVVIWTKRQ